MQKYKGEPRTPCWKARKYPKTNRIKSDSSGQTCQVGLNRIMTVIDEQSIECIFKVPKSRVILRIKGEGRVSFFSS